MVSRARSRRGRVDRGRRGGETEQREEERGEDADEIHRGARPRSAPRRYSHSRRRRRRRRRPALRSAAARAGPYAVARADAMRSVIRARYGVSREPCPIHAAPRESERRRRCYSLEKHARPQPRTTWQPTKSSVALTPARRSARTPDDGPLLANRRVGPRREAAVAAAVDRPAARPPPPRRPHRSPAKTRPERSKSSSSRVSRLPPPRRGLRAPPLGAPTPANLPGCIRAPAMVLHAVDRAGGVGEEERHTVVAAPMLCRGVPGERDVCAQTPSRARVSVG